MENFKLRLGGQRQPPDPGPGVYQVKCINARLQKRGNKRQVVLTFRTQGGIELLLWFDVSSETLSPMSAYVRALEIALKKTLAHDDDLDPEQFVGLSFEADCGFRFDGDPSSTQQKKDHRDFLRVRKLLQRIDSDEDEIVSKAKSIFGGRVVEIKR